MRKKWSRKYSKCKRCNTTKTKHRAKGYCVNCYFFLISHKNNPDMGYLDQWALHFKKCKICGTTARKHISFGFCKECYFKFIKKDYIREYMGKYWHTHKEQYKKHKKNVGAYQKTPKGREMSKRSKKRFLEKNPNYMRDYKKKWEEKHKKLGLCFDCCKKSIKGKIFCKYHLLKRKGYYRNKNKK